MSETTVGECHQRRLRASRSTRRLVAILLGVVIQPAAVYAQSCGSGGQYVAEVWDTYMATAREAGCLAPGIGPLKMTACAVNLPIMALHMVDRMVGWWNAKAKGGWATIGPRRLSPSWQIGTVVGTTGRLFIGTAPVHSSTTVMFQKLEGIAPADIVICAHPQNGPPRVLATYRYEKGAEVNLNDGVKLFIFSDLTADLISVKIDATDWVPTNRFKYRIKVETDPVKFDLGPVPGFADLHLHQAAELGFGGNQLHGNHTGPPAEALKSDFLDDRVHARVLAGPVQWALGMHSLPGAAIDEGTNRHGDGYPRFREWPHFDNVTHQQVHEDWLKAAHDGGLNLVVVSAVNFEPWCFILKILYPRAGDRMGCRDMENVTRQIEAFIAMDEKHDWYEIAVHPWHARKIIHEGKLAVVISMEISNLFPPGEGHFINQLDRLRDMGLRTLQLAHETDSEFAGAAPHRGTFELLQAVKWPAGAFESQIKTQLGIGTGGGFAYDANGKNAYGLSPRGIELVNAMVDRQMLIDVSHLSARSHQNVHQLVASRHRYYPLYNSHTRFDVLLNDKDKGTQREFVTTDDQLRQIRETGGIVGIRTGQNAITTFIDPDTKGVDNDCAGSSKSFAQLVSYGRRAGIPMGLGSDFNGFINQLGPRYGKEACPAKNDDNPRVNQDYAPKASCSLPPNAKVGPINRDFDNDGLKHVGYLPDLISDLEALKAPGVDILKSSAEAFIQMWERAYDPQRSKIDDDVDLAAQIAGAVKPWSPCDLYRGPAGVLADLSGDWVRVVSNNRPNDRMRITIGAGEAMLTFTPPGVGSFHAGQVLWTDIAADGSLKVRGSDGNYYASTFTMEGKDRLNLKVDHTGAGFVQTWERAGPSIDGDWELLSGGLQANQGMRISVEGDRATLRYMPASASRNLRIGIEYWRGIGRGDSANSGRLEALTALRTWEGGQFTLSGDEELRLVVGTDGTTQRWVRPGRAAVLAAAPPGVIGTIGALPANAISGIASRIGAPQSFDLLALGAAARLPAAVTGMVFRDLDGNGEWDLGEPPIVGVRVQVLDAAGGAAPIIVSTDSSGVYRFESNSGGQFRLSVDQSSLPLGGVAPQPQEHEVEVDRGFTTPGVNFSVRPGQP